MTLASLTLLLAALQAAEEPGEGGAVGPRSTHTTHSSGGGKHAYARAQMGKLNQQRDSMSQEKPGRELPQAFQLPPVVTEQFSRTASVSFASGYLKP